MIGPGRPRTASNSHRTSDAETCERRGHFSKAAALAAGAGVGVFALCSGLLFLVGSPMGHPFGSWFNLVFIGAGAVFVAIGVASYFKSTTITAGDHKNLHAGRSVGARQATARHDKISGLMFIVVGVFDAVTAVFMGSLFGP